MLLKNPLHDLSNKISAKRHFKTKFQILHKTTKPLLSKGFVYIYLLFFILIYMRLFPDTKLAKNGVQQILVGDMPRNETQMMQGMTKLMRYQIARQITR